MSDAGRELVDLMTAALDAGRDPLAISADRAVRRIAGVAEHVAASLAAAVARCRARQRFMDAEQWLFTRESLEQASDPAVSAWRAGRYLDAIVVDLCSGVGGDAAALLATARELATVEQDEARAVLARHNLAVASTSAGRTPGVDDAGTSTARSPEVGDVGTSTARAPGVGHVDTSTACAPGVGGPNTAVRIGVGDALDVAHARRLDAATPQEAPAGEGFRTDGVLVHVDPGRRVGDRRVQDPSMTQPAVDAVLARHQRAAGCGVVLAPGVDADHPALRPLGSARAGPQVVPSSSETGDDGSPDPGVEVEYVQLGGLLVEAVAWTGVLRSGSVRASATLLPRPDGPGPGVGPIHRLVRSGERGPRQPVETVGTVLVEVAPAAIRARLHDEVGARLGVARVAEHRALFSGDELFLDPWTRCRPILAVTRARAGALRQWLRDHDVGPVEIATHGVRVDPVAFWRDIGRPPRGPNGVRIELVRRDTDSVAIITDDAMGRLGW